MKKCKYCGTPQSDERHTCVDCGKPLPKPLSAEEAEVIEDALDDQLDAMSEYRDVFEVSCTDRILGILGIVGLIASCLLFAVSQTEINRMNRELQEALMAAAMAGEPLFEITRSTEPLPPTRSDYLDSTVKGSVVAIAFFLESCTLLLFPKFIWFISTIRDRLWYADEPTPSAFAESMMKFSKYGGFVIGCIALAFAAWMYF
ncbi:MAG: hypothetical protein IJW77_12520 [Clostridia bacterium]|nr:hypothetical protein [Clostridia bacterium]